MKRLIIDIDDTVSCTTSESYAQAKVIGPVVEKLKEYKALGFEIIFYSSRNMQTYEGNVGKINIHTLPIIIDWLIKNNIPFDEVYVGKPWCGHEGFYVDDKAIRPDEFVTMSYEELRDLLAQSAVRVANTDK